MIGLDRIEGAGNLPVSSAFLQVYHQDKMRIRTGKRAPHDKEGRMEVNKKVKRALKRP